jgi:hypothetical protein
MISQQRGIVARRPSTAKLSSGKQIVYRFNGDPKNDEIVSDRTNSLSLRKVGEILKKKGKAWRVAVIRDDFNMNLSQTAVHIHRVFLTSNI